MTTLPVSIRLRAGLLVSLGLLASAGAATASVRAQNRELADLLDKIHVERDAVDEEVIEQVAAIQSREAARGLVEAYDELGSLGARRAVIRALGRFDGVRDAEEVALEKLANIATNSPDVEVREWSMQALADCPHLGKSFLARIVDAPADDRVRSYALRCFLPLSGDGDREWLLRIYAPVDSAKGRGANGLSEAEPASSALRELAFEGLASGMTVAELRAAVEDARAGIRVLALEELGHRADGAGRDLAADRLERGDEDERVRVAAARALAGAFDKKLAAQFVDIGMKGNTPRSVSYALADILAQADDAAIKKRLLGKFGKGKAHQKLFTMRALASHEDPKIEKALLKLVLDKDLEVQTQATRMLGERGVVQGTKVLEKMLAKAKDSLVVTAGLTALSRIRGDDPQWRERLKGYLSGEDASVRNAAVRTLAELDQREYLPEIVELLDHDHWSTRLAALEVVEQLRWKEAVGAIIERLDVESGVVLNRFTDTLFRLTGKPFRKNAQAWKAWWKNEGASFELVSPSELTRLEADEEARRLGDVSKAATKFFGIRIESTRVVFIVDVSGSMNEMTKPLGGGVEDISRIDVAKHELERAIDALDTGTLFNIIAFSGAVTHWIDGSIGETDSVSRDEAKQFVARLGALGGTNLYGALQAAFDDADVDTIYLLSDGEPSVGDVIDAATIRDHVHLWNENRGVTIHCVSIGADLQVLEWIAADSGGSYLECR